MMLGLLRAYMYWAVLWGFLVHPALGLRSAAPLLLVSVDLLTMGSCVAYVVMNLGRVAPGCARQAHLTGLVLIAISAYSLGITNISGGSVVESAKYIAVLFRPVLVLLALYVYTKLPRTVGASQVFYKLRLDVAILTTAQLIVATIQLLDPATGAEFIASLAEHHSAVWALDDGDVSGTFANSIELSYFLLAAYVVFTLDRWQLKRPPPVLLSLLILFYVDATGSIAASVITFIYMGYLTLRCMTASSRRIVYLMGGLLIGLFVYEQSDLLITAAVSKFDDMMLSRLGLIFISLPELIIHAPVKLITGQGGDFSVVLGLLNSLPDVPLVFTYDDASNVINDVFWVALTLALGLPATLLFLIRVTTLFSAFIGAESHDSRRAALLHALVLLIFLAGMLNQILLVRSFVLPLLLGLTVLGMSAPLQAQSACADR